MQKMILLVSILCGGFVWSPPAQALKVRVDPAGGAPRILVNGAPVRARMFWGGPGSGPLRLNAQPRNVNFEFVASESATTGTMHFRFGEKIGTTVLDDIRVTDVDEKRDVLPICTFDDGDPSFAREWNVWPPEEKSNVVVVPKVGRGGSGGLQVQVKAPAQGNWPDFHLFHNADLSFVKGRRYRVSFWVRADAPRELTVAFYRPGENFTHLGGLPSSYESQIRLAASAGVNFVSFPIQLPWPEPGQAVDWSGVEAACRNVLRVNPKALLIPRIEMKTPAWWCAANPDDVMRWEDGVHGNYAVPASPRYRRDASERLAALVRHLEATLGDHIAGYHPSGQNTGEWFYEGTWEKPLSGYAPADLAAWRRWLRTRYREDAALRRAWSRTNGANATLDTASVPTPAERHASPNGIFRDPQSERHIIDWSEFQQQAMADCVIELSRATRIASRGQKLVLSFYGYLFEFAYVSTGPANSGHYALRRILDCPDIDVLCAPISYFDRGLGGSAPTMTAAESISRAGKIWLNEDDTHTYLATGAPPGAGDHVTTIEETNDELMRNVAQASLRNFGTWWMDLTATGWFDDPAMWNVMARLKALDEPLLRKPTPFRPPIAAIIDERAMLHVAENGYAATGSGIFNARQALGRIGAPYGQYLQDEIAPDATDKSGRPPLRAKMYVMLNPWLLSSNTGTKLPSQSASLLRGMRGAMRVWCFASGYFEDGHRASPDAMRRLTGFTLKSVPSTDAWATPTALGRKWGLTQAFGVHNPLRPLMAAADATAAETLATFPDGSAAVALRRTASGPSLFVGAPALTSELLRLAAREAGVHLFTQSDCNVYANGPFLAIHASQDGPVEINTGKKGAVYDALTGAKVANGPKFTLRLKRGATRLLRY